MTEHEDSELSEQDNERCRLVGQRLQDARLQRGLSLQDVSRSLRLPGLTVSDIEEGRMDRLARPYRRGYVANYARLVGLEPSVLLDQLGQCADPALRNVLPASRRGWRLERYIKSATYIVATIAIVPPLIFFFVQSGSRIASPEPESGVEQLASETGYSDDQRVARRIARALALDNADPVDTDNEGHVTASALPLRPTRPARESEPALEELLPSVAALSEEIPAIPVLELSLELLEDSWVEVYAADGRRLEFDLLRAGQLRNFSGEPPFRLLLGRANAVRVLADGEPVLFPGHERADVVNLEILEGGEVKR
ncbi:MAG: DUF4115 domain-containing protein [Wenzhouxiangella sp.]|nr:DUF4115 domain-containing protein [Wenzhouxiangella sp.]TVR95654.1 MAG: DUF4115 domain-containing protein [Wenzhouxiangellaceae bacterium]